MVDQTQNRWKTPSTTRMPPADSKSNIIMEGMRTELAKNSQLRKRKAAEVGLDGHEGQTVAYRERICFVYQSGDDLCDDLARSFGAFQEARAVSSQHLPYVNFHGAYSIIADPSIPAAKRVKLVSSELCNIVEYPHSNNVHARPLTAKCWTETFRCDCSKGRVIVSSVPQPPPPSLSPTSTTPPSSQPEKCNASVPAGAKPLKRTQSSLSHWVAGASKKHKPDTAPVGAPPQTDGKQGQSGVSECGAYVQITVEEEAHPLCSYIKGQMISVLVEHPTQMAPVK